MADERQAIICCREGVPSMFDDNVHGGKCVRCGHGVYHRPHMPPGDLVCLQCTLAAANAGELDDTRLEVTAAVVKDLANAGVLGDVLRMLREERQRQATPAKRAAWLDAPVYDASRTARKRKP